MKTETLLNIRPEVPKGDEGNAKQALSQNSGAVSEADSFKSALMQQIGQHKAEHNKTDKEPEVDLPQDGNALPDKENTHPRANNGSADVEVEQAVLAEQLSAEQVLFTEQGRVEQVISWKNVLLNATHLLYYKDCHHLSQINGRQKNSRIEHPH